MASVQDNQTAGRPIRGTGSTPGSAVDRISRMARSSEDEIERMKRALSQLDAKLHAADPRISARRGRRLQRSTA